MLLLRHLMFAPIVLTAGACSSSSGKSDSLVGREASSDFHMPPGEAGGGDLHQGDSRTGPPRWETIKNAPSVRYHTATVLTDGSVLIAGGEQEITSGAAKLVTDTWLYKPATNSFVSAGKLASGRTDHTASLLPDGRVLLAGGQQDSWTFLDSVQIFDPTKPPDQAWSAGKPLPTGRGKHTAVTLGDKRLALIGGSGVGTGGAPFDYDSIVVYDPASGTWNTTTAKLKQKRYYHTATLLAKDKVLVAGGVQSGTEIAWLDTFEIWDTSTGNVTASAAKMSQPRAYHTAHLLPSGKVLLVGGRCGVPRFCTLNSDQLYDPALDKVVDLPHHGFPPAGHAAISLPDKRVVVTGSWDKPLATKAIVFAPADSSWRELPDLPAGRGGHTASLLVDSSVLLVGGQSPDTELTLGVAERLFNP